jgi:AcrR family transcriptional regulator
VAQRAGCTTGAVTYYFANKQAMMAAVIESRFDVFDSMLGGGGRKVNIKAGFERSLALTQQEDIGGWVAGFQILAHARHDPALAAVYTKRYKHYREAFASILAGGQRQGDIRDDIPADLLADQLSAMTDGWMMMIPIEAGRFQPERLRALIDATVALVAPQPPSERALRA